MASFPVANTMGRQDAGIIIGRSGTCTARIPQNGIRTDSVTSHGLGEHVTAASGSHWKLSPFSILTNSLY